MAHSNGRHATVVVVIWRAFLHSSSEFFVFFLWNMQTVQFHIFVNIEKKISDFIIKWLRKQLSVRVSLVYSFNFSLFNCPACLSTYLLRSKIFSVFKRSIKSRRQFEVFELEWNFFFQSISWQVIFFFSLQQYYICQPSIPTLKIFPIEFIEENFVFKSRLAIYDTTRVTHFYFLLSQHI